MVRANTDTRSARNVGGVRPRLRSFGGGLRKRNGLREPWRWGGGTGRTGHDTHARFKNRIDRIGRGGRQRAGSGNRNQFEFEQPAGAFTAALLREHARDPADARFADPKGLGRALFVRRLVGAIATGRSGLLRTAGRAALAREFTGLDCGPNVIRRRDAAGLGPRQLLFECEAATIAGPALFAGGAPARVVLTRERYVTGLVGGGPGEHRRPGCTEQLRQQCHDRHGVTEHTARQSSGQPHGSIGWEVAAFYYNRSAPPAAPAHFVQP